jgi:hypothetical protein
MTETQAQSSIPVRARGGILSAGSGGWYTLLAAAFLSCSFNPVAAIALSMGSITPHEVYTTARGGMLTGASFLLGAIGLTLAEWIAWRGRNRRALEISSILTCGASLIAFSVGMAVLGRMMFPIGILYVAIGGFGLWTTRTIPDIAELPEASTPPTKPAKLSADPPPNTGAEGGRRKRKRRRKKRGNASTSGRSKH